MMILGMELKGKSLAGSKCFSWLFEESDGGERFVASRKRGYIFISLFYVTFLAFCFMALYLIPCYTLPISDNITSRQFFEQDERVFHCTISYDDVSSYHEIVPFNDLIGVIDPTKQFPTLFGFSCSYTNYIKSTSYKCTDIS